MSDEFADPVPVAMLGAAWDELWDLLGTSLEPVEKGDVYNALYKALRADPLRAYIREQLERVPCPRCKGRLRWCSKCGFERTLPRYQAEGGTEAFIAGLEARL